MNLCFVVSVFLDDLSLLAMVIGGLFCLFGMLVTFQGLSTSLLHIVCFLGEGVCCIINFITALQHFKNHSRTRTLENVEYNRDTVEAT